ncbi:MAG: substrate-binding domain-containing protein [Bacillota bacterium]
MKKKMPGIFIAVLLILVMVLTGCASTPTEEGEEAAATPSEERTFAIVFPIVHPFFEPVAEKAQAYADEVGVKLLVYAPDKFDVRQQIEILENLIAMKVDGIAVVPTDSEVVAPIINKALDAGIQVIAFESDIPKSNRKGFQGTDNLKAGIALGEEIGKQLNGKGKIIVATGLPTQLSLNQRLDGMKQVLGEKYPDIEILDIQSGQGDPSITLSVIESMIQAHPDFDVFSGIDATGGPVAAAIWKAKGWTKEDKMIITFDNVPENIQGVKDGIITSLISQKQWTWGDQLIKDLNTLCDGGSVPNYVDTGNVVINIDNVDTYMD